MVTVEIEATEIKERKADSKGRVALGPDLAGKQVRVAVVEVLENGGEQPAN